MLPVELPVEHIEAATLQLGTILRLQRSIGSTPSRTPWETNMRGEPVRPAGAMSPGENASTCVKRSPLVIPKESA